MAKPLAQRFDEIEALAKKMGLDPFPIFFQEVPREIIWDVASYGLPTRMSHWSFGRSYVHQKTYGEMGFGKIYELIINNNPAYAFLDETNSDVINLLVCAHVLGHSDFFKNNACFAGTNRNMVNMAAQNAQTIEEAKAKFGLETVEEWMDAAFALDTHIDPRLGEYRKKYPEQQHVFKTTHPLPYADLFGEDMKPQVTQEIKNTAFPPHAERDILWFLINYAQMLPDQREIFNIIRSESYYFHPQALTKICNEGWASWVHAEMMLNYDDLTPSEHLDFSIAHAGVISPGVPLRQKKDDPEHPPKRTGRFNPYFVGFRIFTDIKKRWDKYYEEGQKDAAFQKSNEIDHFDEKGNVVLSKMNGFQKLLKVRAEDDDISFVRNFLTRELAEEIELFTYGYEGGAANPDEDNVIIKDRALDAIVRGITDKLHNYGAPLIWVDKVEPDMSLIMRHSDNELPLEETYTKETLKYVYKAWKKPVHLITHDRFGKTITYTCDDKTVAVAEGGAKTVHMQI